MMESNYILPASKKLFLEHGVSSDNCQTNKLKELVLINANRLLLNEVSIIQRCTSLTVCILSNNFITNIDALQGCCNIIKLDLHGNQIERLPPKTFWCEFKKLKLLYLHDNGIGSVENVESLSACPNLAGLTLYDTPLSLLKTYRHMVVNTIWSLKALDEYVVSDEEIIEDWHLADRFKALNPNFQINMIPVPKEEVVYQDELKAVQDIITKMNHILSHYSPVLIIQKFIRGYIIRKRLGIITPMKMQRKKMRILHETSQEEDKSQGFVNKMLTYNVPTVTYTNDGLTLPMIKQSTKQVNSTPVNEVMRITVDLNKIHRGLLQVLPDAEFVYHLGNQSQQSSSFYVTELIKDEKGNREIKSKICHQKDQTAPCTGENKAIEVGLSGLKVTVHKPNPLKDTLIPLEDSANDIRNAIRQFHMDAKAKLEPLPHTQKQFQKRGSGEGIESVQILPFCVIDRAYENRQKYDIRNKKKNLVAQIHVSKKQAKSNSEEYLQEKRKQAMMQNEKDCVQIEQGVKLHQLNKSNLIEKSKQRNKHFFQEKEQKESEILFAQDFNKQHTSVTKALLKHNRMVASDRDKREKSRLVQDSKEQKERHRVFIECLKAHRQLVLQAEHAAEKAGLDSLVLRKANDKLRDAKAHVKASKGRQVTVAPMSKILVNQPVSKETHEKYLSI
ncbi:leucine-rich repeat and IQ domain-containing protein 3 [Discoglossus pictus]